MSDKLSAGDAVKVCRAASVGNVALLVDDGLFGVWQRGQCCEVHSTGVLGERVLQLLEQGYEVVVKQREPL